MVEFDGVNIFRITRRATLFFNNGEQKHYIKSNYAWLEEKVGTDTTAGIALNKRELTQNSQDESAITSKKVSENESKKNERYSRQSVQVSSEVKQVVDPKARQVSENVKQSFDGLEEDLDEYSEQCESAISNEGIKTCSYDIKLFIKDSRHKLLEIDESNYDVEVYQCAIHIKLHQGIRCVAIKCGNETIWNIYKEYTVKGRGEEYGDDRDNKTKLSNQSKSSKPDYPRSEKLPIVLK
ncbi:hypothetical protein MACK_002478 [Theileria orientalis]|uniref:Uncharacterized protein n=1 Tax=Theileria orientalis TaxID=68886 RepID=A0A976QT56_THEOR|nr:hypothetical protein MACK_002478 [Theileria orientalis]